MPITASDPFKWRHYPGDVILWCVRWYLRYPLSVAHVVSPSCIWRWVQEYGPELDKRCRHHMKPTTKSWRVDETYIKVNGEDRFLYRAVDSTGQTIDFLLVATDELKKEGTIRRRCRLRQRKYLNNVVEQSHRNAKRRTRRMDMDRCERRGGR